MKKLFLLITIIITMLFREQVSFSQETGEGEYIPETDTLAAMKIREWQDLKFGLLMHWGPYSQWGVVESWSICSEDEDWCRRNNQDYSAYKKDYENLQSTFNPTDFNPEKWAVAARDAGMRYVVFTTKHHDGFCMFDSRYTDYKITSPATPFHSSPKANITLEIFNAFRAEGLWTGAYFSKPDWHSEDYWWPNFATPDRNVNYSVTAYPERWNRFVEYTHNQVMELMTGYGKVDILWLDGGWVRKYSEEEVKSYYRNASPEKLVRVQNQDIRMDELVVKARKKQPGLIVVDRAVHGKNQNYLTPENRVPEEPLPYPWESCIISGGGWSWSFDPHYMSGRQAVHMLVDIVVKGGNLLLNVAPGPDGDWHPEAYRLLADIGLWMKVNSEAIYGTRPVEPYKEGKVCLSRKGDNTYYIYYLADEGEAIPATIGMSNFILPAGSRVELLGGKGLLKWENRDGGFLVSVPSANRKMEPLNFVYVFEVSY